MKKRVLFLVFLIISFITFSDITLAQEVASCGGIGDIPKSIPSITNFLFRLIKYVVPIAIVIVGSLDFFKASAGSDQEMLKKALNSFFKKLIAGAVVFLIILIVQIGISLISSDKNITQCINCFIVDKNVCTYSEEEIKGSNSGEIIQDYENNKEPEQGLGGNKEGEQGSVGNEGTEQDSDGNTTAETYNIFVGDSRTNGMKLSVGSKDNVSWVAKDGSGYTWFTDSAISSVDGIVRQTGTGKKYNIILLFGVNDVGNNSEAGSTIGKKYFNKYKELKNSKWSKHNIIVVSVNPVVDGKSSASNAAIKAFNNTMFTSIRNEKSISYCDTNSYVKFGINNDGLHYDTKTYANIYNYIIDKCIK